MSVIKDKRISDLQTSQFSVVVIYEKVKWLERLTKKEKGGLSFNIISDQSNLIDCNKY